MSRTRRLALTISLVLAAALAGPAASTAVQPEGSCGSERGRSFTLAVPDGLRTVGVHRFQFLVSGTDVDGSPFSFTTDNQIEVTTAAPTYENLHLRLVRNRGLLADGTVDPDVHTMTPSQQAAFYAQISGPREIEPAIASAVMDVRWETRRNRWSDWTSLAAGPMSSFCLQQNDGVLRKSFGWAG